MLSFYLSMIETEEDKSKFELIYHEYRDLIYSVAIRILCSEQESEDVTQEVFVTVIDHIGDVDSVYSKRTRNLMITLAKHKALNIIRHEKVKEKSALDPTLESIDQTILSAELEKQQDAQSLASYILKLPQHYQQVLRLQYYNNFSTEKIAALLDMTPVNVRKISSRAKNKLRELMKGDLRHEGLSVE